MTVEDILATTANDTTVFAFNQLLTGQFGIQQTVPRYNAYNPHPDKSLRIPHAIPEDQLPVVLPLDVADYKPVGKSPLADHATFPYYTAQTPVQQVPFFEITPRHDNAVVEPRVAVAAIIKHWSDEKYLFIKPSYEPILTLVM